MAHKRKAGGEGAVSGALRRAIAQSGLTLYRISKESGVPYATLHRFATGRSGVSLVAVDKLCRALGLELRPAKE